METVNKTSSTMIVQKLEKTSPDPIAQAQRYYGLISSLNSLQLTEREIQLIAFSAVKGSISFTDVKKEFCEKYNSSSATIGNLLIRLKKLGIFIKHHKLTVVNPQLVLDFSKPIVLQITLTIPTNMNVPVVYPVTTVANEAVIAPISQTFKSEINGKANNNAPQGVVYKEAGS